MTTDTAAPAQPSQGLAFSRRFPTISLLFSSRRSRILVGVLLGLTAFTLIYPHVAAFGPNQQELARRLEGPSAKFWLGTDGFGRDILTLLAYGGRTTIIASCQATGLALLVGMPLGLFAGYLENWFTTASEVVFDVLLSLPPLILALAVIAITGPGVTNAMIAVGVVLSPRFFRVARAAAKAVSEELYVEAARSVGCGTPRILVRYVLSNAVAPILVQLTFAVGVATVAEASLSFLGLGAQPPSVSLGTMVRNAFDNLHRGVWPMLPPSIVIATVVYGVSALGDALRDALGTSRTTA